jgi:thioredoxin-like negative regulator of GroEL
MNEFQAILTIVVYFAVRIGIPALIIFALARLIRHFQGPDPEESDSTETRIAH